MKMSHAAHSGAGGDRAAVHSAMRAASSSNRGIASATPRTACHFDVVQSNVSRSVHGVLRGLHYQWPNPQGKLVSVLDGEVWDVAVDIRRGSPTFGQWEAVVLSGANRRQFWIPEGFAHGFVVTSARATFSYLCTAHYDSPPMPPCAGTTPGSAIDWPVAAPAARRKDAQAPLLDAGARSDLLPAVARA